MPLQFTSDNLSVVFVVFDDKNADGIRIALPGRSGEFDKLITFLTQITVVRLVPNPHI
jgi:hypothetical protein